MSDMHVVARYPGMLMVDPLQSLYPSLVLFSACRHNAQDAAHCARNVHERCLADTMPSRDCGESLFRGILCFCRIFSAVTRVFGACSPISHGGVWHLNPVNSFCLDVPALWLRITGRCSACIGLYVPVLWMFLPCALHEGPQLWYTPGSDRITA